MEEEKVRVLMIKKDSNDQEERQVMEDEPDQLPGFRFHPTDEELVGFYLRRKVNNQPLSIEIIKQVDIYKYEPWDLPKLSTVRVGDKEWYFFCLRGRKYRNSIRPNRVTGCGFWKATGIDKPIYSSAGRIGGNCIGLKKSLVYYRGSAGKGTKTDWMMHEFRVPPHVRKNDDINSNDTALQEAEVWTICRIFKRNCSSQRKPTTQAWKDQPQQQYQYQTPVDSSSKSYSNESETCDAYGATTTYESIQFKTNCQQAQPHQEESSFAGCCLEDENHSYLNNHWNYRDLVAHQGSSTASPSGFPILNPSVDIIRDWNWEEIGRMVEVMIDPATIGHDCRLF